MRHANIPIPLIAAGLTGVTLLFQMWLKTYKGLFRWAKSVRDRHSPFRRIDQKIDKLLEELYTDGGKSLRAVVETTCTEVVVIGKRQSESTARVLSLLDESPKCMWEADPTGNRTWFNRAFLSLVGRTTTELVGYGWINIIHWDDRARVRTNWEQAVHERRNFEEKYRIVKADGSIIYVETIARPCVLNGELVSFIGGVTPLQLTHD